MIDSFEITEWGFYINKENIKSFSLSEIQIVHKEIRKIKQMLEEVAISVDE